VSMSWSQFIGIPNGTRIVNYGFDQCVALANLYHEQVIGGSFVAVPSAFQWWTRFSEFATLRNNYMQIPASGNPLPGDFFVSRGGIYNAPHGHIGVVVRGWDGFTFGTKEQNAERNRYVWQVYNRSKANMLGYLRPKNNPAAGGTGLEKFMRVTWDTNGTGYLVTEDGFEGLPSMQYYNLFTRLINSTPAAPDRFNPTEIKMMHDVLQRIARRNGSTVTANIDPTVIAKAVNDDAAKRMQS